MGSGCPICGREDIDIASNPSNKEHFSFACKQCTSFELSPNETLNNIISLNKAEKLALSLFVRNEYLKSNEKKIILPKYDTGFYSNLLLSKTLNKINDLIEYFGDKSLMLGDEIEIKGNNFELEVVASVVDEAGIQMILRYLENEDLIEIKKDDKETDTKKIILSVKGWLKYEELEANNG